MAETRRTVTPYVCLRGTSEAIDFYQRAFGAKEVMRQADPDGKVRHAEIEIGDSLIMLHDEFPEFSDMRSPVAMGGSPVHIFLTVADADATARQALAAGATLIKEVKDESYGRSGGVKDPFGLTWWVCS